MQGVKGTTPPCSIGGVSTPPVLVSCSTCGRAVVAASPAETNSADFQCFECWDAQREREQLAALELDRRIEADETAALREHGAPDEERRA